MDAAFQSQDMHELDQSDFKQIVAEYHPLIFKICRAYSEEFDMEDLYQEVLINVWAGLKNYKGDAKLSTWMYRVTLNTAMTYHRDKKRRRSHILRGIEIEKPDQSEDAQEKERRVQELYNALRQLPKDDRSIILLYLEEKKYDEIAEITGLTPSNVGVRINRAKKKLKQLLSSRS